MRRRWKLLTAAALAILIAGGALLTLQSEWLKESIRLRLVSEIDRLTGGKSRLLAFDFNWRTWEARADNVQLRGLEPADKPMLFEAGSIRLRLSMKSWLTRDIDLSELTMVAPKLNVFVDAQGNTNIPGPRIGQSPIQRLLDARIGKVEIQKGVITFDSKVIPVNVVAENVGAVLKFLPRQKAYDFDLGADGIQAGVLKDAAVNASGELEANRILLRTLRLTRGSDIAEFKGSVEDLSSPRVEGELSAAMGFASIPGSPLRSGSFRLAAKGSWAQTGDYSADGEVSFEGVNYSNGRVALRSVSGQTPFRLTPELLDLPAVRLKSGDAAVNGKARLGNWRELEVSADIDGLTTQTVQELLQVQPLPWKGVLSGSVDYSARLTRGALRGQSLQADVKVAPLPNEPAVRGGFSIDWAEDSDRLSIRGASLATDATRLSVAGDLGRDLQIQGTTTSIEDVASLIATFTGKKLELPISLHQGGSLNLDGVVSGTAAKPEFAGRVEAKNLWSGDLLFEEATAQARVSAGQLTVSSLQLRQEATVVAGSGSLALRDWDVPEDAAFRVQLQLSKARIERVLRRFGYAMPITGTVDGKLTAEGTLLDPKGEMSAQGANILYDTERIEKATVRFRLGSGTPAPLEGQADLEDLHLELKGSYAHAPRDWKNGELRMQARERDFRLIQSEVVQKLRAGLDGVGEFDLTARARIENGKAKLQALDGSLALERLRLDGRPFGRFELKAVTKGQELNVEYVLDARERKMEGAARVQLTGNLQSKGTLKFPPTSLRLIRELAAPAKDVGEIDAIPVRGFAEGSLTWEGPLEEPSKLRARLTIERMQLRPRNTQVGDTQLDASDLTLRIDSPVVVDITNESAKVERANLKARSTDVTLSGAYSFGDKGSMNFTASGGVELAVLSRFYPDLVATGRAEVNARIRGTPANPIMNGKMSLSGASLYLKNVSNGIEEANGTIAFDSTVANIEKLTGKTGGGTFSLTGFIGFSRDTLLYRLQTRAEKVRIRYPEGVSTTASADLALTGSSDRSLLSGNVTISRASISQQNDLVAAVGSTSTPLGSLSGSRFLQNLQFDVKVRTAADAEFISGVTKDVQVKADLRLRGSAAKPVLLGDVQLSDGEVNFLGSRYTVSRGELLFFETATLEPSIDIDLETRVRGIVVFIKVSGPLNRLNVSYRSEPPMTPSDIVGLLASGSAPSAQGGFGTSAGMFKSPNVLGTTNNSNLMAGALNAGLNQRMDKFFGPRILIDPQVTGIENIPQARITIEQSFSKNVTLAVGTNIARTGQQMVRLDWDISREYSLVIIRDENGVFGVDLIYRKRFK